jgi:hypothetical protein
MTASSSQRFTAAPAACDFRDGYTFGFFFTFAAKFRFCIFVESDFRTEATGTALLSLHPRRLFCSLIYMSGYMASR